MDDLNILPGQPQLSHKLRTFDEYLKAKGILTPPSQDFVDRPITIENKVNFILKVIEMMNLCVNEEGMKSVKEYHKDLFVKRDDVYYDDKRKMYFLKEDRSK